MPEPGPVQSDLSTFAQEVSFEPLTFYCAKGSSSRGVFAFASTDGNLSDAFVVNGFSIIESPQEFVLTRRRIAILPAWRIEKVSNVMHEAFRGLLSENEKIRLVISDGTLRFWPSNSAMLLERDRRSISDFFGNYFSLRIAEILAHFSPKNLLAIMLGAILYLILLPIIAFAQGQNFMEILGALACLSVACLLPFWVIAKLLGGLIFGDGCPRHIALVTDSRSFLLTFIPRFCFRRVKSNNALELPKRTRSRLHNAGKSLSVERAINVFPQNYELSEVILFDFQQALSTETIAFELAFRFLCFFKTKTAYELIEKFKNSQVIMHRDVANRVLSQYASGSES